MAKTALKRVRPRTSADKRLVKESLRLIKRVREAGIPLGSGYSLAVPFSTRLDLKPQSTICASEEVADE